ncbi:MAG: tRNA threonylcarbamoyladenosine dehydratase [Oscillospiraceae bacterium]|nr:tRNA threonylcarbamoyladenosine dehydratase [Oscillospiraceae bacterium]
MEDIFIRTELLYGKKAMENLKNSRVAVFGVGGVGGYVVEALVRSGIGAIDLIDKDTVDPSNINRQIIATTKTIGRSKVDVAKERALEINPDIKVNTYNTFFLPETAKNFDFSRYDYVVDAIDTVTGKIQLVISCEETHTPIISSMGAGNKINPTGFEVTDIYKTSVCPLARVMRQELKKRGIKKLKVVYSKEQPLTPMGADNNNGGKRIPGSTAFVPSVVGLTIAGEIINYLSNL